MAYTDEQKQRLTDLMRPITIKAQFARIVAKELRDTPEYAEARAEGNARAWVQQEADSAAEMLYEAMLRRLDDLDPFHG